MFAFNFYFAVCDHNLSVYAFIISFTVLLFYMLTFDCLYHFCVLLFLFQHSCLHLICILLSLVLTCLFMQMFLSNVTVNGQVRQVRMGRFHGDGPDGRVLCSQPMVVPEAS